MTNFLIFLLSLTLSLIPVPCQPNEFTYKGFHNQNVNISLSDSAQINKNGILQLTSDKTKLTGHAFYSLPFQFKNSDDDSTAFSFSTCFAFSIQPGNARLGGGDGLAFTIARSRDFSSAVWGGHLGLFDSSNVGSSSNLVFAVEFDTYQNFEYEDINDNHVGIDINSLVSNKSATAAYYGNDSMLNDLNLKGGKPIMVWIEYDSVTSFIFVTLSPSSSKPETSLLSLQLDLSPILEENMYVGFSASTGLLASSHYLLGWSFKMNGEASSLDLSSLPSPPRIKKNHHTGLVVGVSVAGFIFILASILTAFLIRKIKNAEVIEAWELEIGPQRYKYQELKQATRGFKDIELLGSGGFGRVYKGTLLNPKTEVAVKRISHESKQGVREFVSEISSIGRFRHRNLVQLQGWCRRGGELLLVYDFMPNGSLDKYLFDEPKCILNWEQRFRIIKGVASGLLYLHEGYEQIVIHRDVKSSNVLLDSEMNGRLGDFGLAKLYDHGADPGTTRIVGTLGYLAPELSRTGRATTSSDVFAFGTLLLEVATGRRPVESAGNEDLVLVDHVWKKWREGSVLDVVDVKMMGEFDENEVMMVVKLGLMCSSNDQSARPSMRQVVSYLIGEVEMPTAVAAPGVCADVGGFEDYLHSYASSSYEKTDSFTAQHCIEIRIP